MFLSIEKRFGLADYRWVEGTEETWGEGITLKIRRWGNRDHEKHRQKVSSALMGPVVTASLKNSIGAGDRAFDFELDDEAVQLYTKKDFEGVANFILADWRGVNEVSDDGEELEEAKYTPEIGLKVLCDNPRLFDLIVEEAQEQTKYRDEFLRATAKN